MNKPEDFKQTLPYEPSLFSFESYGAYSRLETAIRDHISTRNILEEMWTSEIVEAEWEIMRLRRYKGQIVRSAKLTALRNLLNSISDGDDDETDDLARRSFTNKAIRKQVNAILQSIDLDESAVEVEAYRLSMHYLKEIDCRLMELAKRRDKVLRQIEDHRAGMAVPPRPGPRQRPGLTSDLVDG